MLLFLYSLWFFLSTKNLKSHIYHFVPHCFLPVADGDAAGLGHLRM